MKKLIKNVAAWLSAQRERVMEKRASRENRRLTLESERTVQIMEYGGDVWIGYRGEPVLPVDGLKWDLPKTLTAMRGAFVEWHSKEARYGRG